jgi:hypothetical protein
VNASIFSPFGSNGCCVIQKNFREEKGARLICPFLKSSKKPVVQSIEVPKAEYSIERGLDSHFFGLCFENRGRIERGECPMILSRQCPKRDSVLLGFKKAVLARVSPSQSKARYGKAVPIIRI